MIESQLKPCGVVSPRVVAAFFYTPREDYVAPARRTLAYVDAAQQLGHGRELMPPLSLGFLIEEAAVRAEDRVLVVGAATGYSAALLARLAASVTALECEPDLAAAARANLEPFGARAAVVEGPLEAGHAAGQPYSLILIDGAIEVLPPALVAQLEEGGRMVTILIGGDGVARAAKGTKRAGIVPLDPFAEAAAAVLPPFRKPPAFRF